MPQYSAYVNTNSDLHLVARAQRQVAQAVGGKSIFLFFNLLRYSDIKLVTSQTIYCLLSNAELS